MVTRTIQQNLTCLYLLVIWPSVLKYLVTTQTLEIHTRPQTSFTYIWDWSLWYPYLPFLSSQLTQHLSWGILACSLHWCAIKHFCVDISSTFSWPQWDSGLLISLGWMMFGFRLLKPKKLVIYLHLQCAAFSPENESDPDFHEFPMPASHSSSVILLAFWEERFVAQGVQCSWNGSSVEKVLRVCLPCLS